jgi:cathepsin B
MPPTYGTVVHPERNRAKTHTSLRVVALIAISSAALITLLALARGPTPQTSRRWLLQTKLSLDPTGPEHTEASAVPGDFEHQPTEADVASFLEEANAVKTTLKIGNLEQTDLPEACGVSLHPCLAKIGSCALAKIIPSAHGMLTPSTSTCSCFVRGFQEPIPIPDGSDRVVTCDFDCVDAILKYTDSYVSAVNGPGDDVSAFCKHSIELLGEEQFGNKNGYIPTDEDTGDLEMEPIDSHKVVRAGQAVGAFINGERMENCPLKPLVNFTEAEIQYAKSGIVEEGKRQYKMEVLFGTEVFFARVSHLPPSEQLVDPSSVASLDPENLEGRFAVVDLTPSPCDSAIGAQLAVSAAAVEAINKQKLPWTAKLHAGNEGRRLDSFGTGYKPLPAKVMRAYKTTLAVTDFTPPSDYDSRDIYAGQTPCKAYQVLNQGPCGSCYAFAAASAYSARLCRFNPGSIGNVIVSPQEMMDCTNGCDGGNPISVFNSLATSPAVEFWCDPYTAKKSTCGPSCSTSNTYSAQTGSIRTVGDATANGVLQMQLELLQGGPGVAAFTVYSDFQSYSSGVYVVSSQTVVGAHAVSLLGWGVENNVPYWLIQNSWGPNWGMGGFGKIRRGTNEAGIEANGIMVVKALPPSSCPNSNCQNGASTLKSCSCQCSGAWTGPQCTQCSLSCQNGGLTDPNCVACTCPLGYFGASCEGGYQVSPLATCSGDGSVVTVAYTFGGTATAPTQKTFIGVYPVAETKTTNVVTMAMLCGTTFNAAVNGGLCPTSGGSITLVAPTTPGAYKVVVAPFLPPNEFGQSGYATLLDSSKTIAMFTVLPSGCAAADLKTAVAQNDPVALMQYAASVATKTLNQQLAQMKARLDAAQPIISSLSAELPPSLTITGINDANPTLWANGPPVQICYRVPASKNMNPKALVLYVGGPTSNSNYPTGLTGAGVANPLPSDYQSCATVTISAGIPSGAYTIKLVDYTKAPVQIMLASASFNLASAAVQFNGYGLQGTTLTLGVQWVIDASVAKPTDTVKVINSQGTTVFWFFTSCNCKDTPAAGAAAVPSGTTAFSLIKTNAVPGGYTVQFLPGGGAVVAATGPNWINWAQLGW